MLTFSKKYVGIIFWALLMLQWLFIVSSVPYVNASWNNTFHFTYEAWNDALNLMFQNWNDITPEKFEVVLWLDSWLVTDSDDWLLPIDSRFWWSNSDPWKISDVTDYWDWGDWMNYWQVTIETEFVVIWDDEFEWIPVQNWDDVEILRISNIWWTWWLRIANIDWWLTKVYDPSWTYYWDEISDGSAWWQLYYDSVLTYVINNDPTISWTPDASILAWNFYDWTPTWSDPDWDIVVFSWQNIPWWLSLDTASWTISWTASTLNIWVYTWIIISISDTYWASWSLTPFTITVLWAPNDPPSLSWTPSTTWTEWTLYTFTPTLDDNDIWDTWTYSIQNKPSWANFDTGSWTLSWTPWWIDVWPHNGIIISVFDWTDTWSLASFDITINAAPNTNPTIDTIVDQTWTEWVLFSVIATWSDVDSDPVTFEWVDLPSWLSMSSTWVLSWTPTLFIADSSPYTITVKILDGEWWSWTTSFNLTINEMDLITITSNWSINTSTYDEASITWIEADLRWSSAWSWAYIKYSTNSWSLTSRIDLTWDETWADWTFPSLTRWDKYYYKIYTDDDKSNTSSSAILNFTTDKVELTSTWTAIPANTSIQFTWITATILWEGITYDAIVKWSTNSGTVNWWGGAIFSLSWLPTNFNDNLTGLSDGQTYYYRIYITTNHQSDVSDNVTYQITTTSTPLVSVAWNWIATPWIDSVVIDTISVNVSWWWNSFSWAYVKYWTDSWAVLWWWWDIMSLNWESSNLSWEVVSGLTENTTYYYMVYADDTSWVTPTATSPLMNFTTLLNSWISISSTWTLSTYNYEVHWDTWVTLYTVNGSWSISGIQANILWYPTNDFDVKEIRYWTASDLSTYSQVTLWWNSWNLTAEITGLWTWTYYYQILLSDTDWNSATWAIESFVIWETMFYENWIMYVETWTLSTTYNSATINFVKAAVANWWSGTNVFSWAWVEYWTTVAMENKVAMTWDYETNLTANITWLSASTLYYYRVVIEDTDPIHTILYYPETWAVFVTDAVPALPATIVTVRSSWWGWSSIVECVNSDYLLPKSSQLNSNKLVSWNLLFNQSAWEVTRNIVMADCDSRYRVEIDKGTMLTLSGAQFTWELELNRMLKSELPENTGNLTIIRAYNAWAKSWESVDFSWEFSFAAPILI